MPSETTDPPPGTPHPDAAAPTRPAAPPSSDGELDKIPDWPASAAGTSSSDELSQLLDGSLTTLKPDPLLGAFDRDQAPAPHPEAAAPRGDAPAEDASPVPAPHESFDAIAPPTVFYPPPEEPPAVAAPPTVYRQPVPDFSEPPPAPATAVPAPAPAPVSLGSFDGLEPTMPPAPIEPAPASFDAFPSLDLSAGPATKPAPKPEEDEEFEDDDYEDERASRRSSILFMLLFSYASAVTIGLVWVLFSGRRLRESEDVDMAEISADPGHRADQSRKVTPPPVLPADHLTTLGKPIVLGGLEVTPVQITSGRVELQRSFGTTTRKDGGKDALKLTLKLKNVSKDVVFTPLDEAFLRERARGITDSLIETSDGRQIDMYPLAIASEWSILGQDFRELKPGESAEGVIVSAADALERKTPEMTWRVRLRTGLDQTETLGVKFQADQIKPGG